MLASQNELLQTVQDTLILALQTHHLLLQTLHLFLHTREHILVLIVNLPLGLMNCVLLFRLAIEAILANRLDARRQANLLRSVAHHLLFSRLRLAFHNDERILQSLARNNSRSEIIGLQRLTIRRNDELHMQNVVHTKNEAVHLLGRRLRPVDEAIQIAHANDQLPAFGFVEERAEGGNDFAIKADERTFEFIAITFILGELLESRELFVRRKHESHCMRVLASSSPPPSFNFYDVGVKLPPHANFPGEQKPPPPVTMFGRRKSFIDAPDGTEAPPPPSMENANSRTMRFWHFHRDKGLAGPTRWQKWSPWKKHNALLRKKMPPPPPP